MKRQIPQVLLTTTLILISAGNFGIADDRVLLRAEGAPANVLLILDSGASMTHDPRTNSINFLAAGDDSGQFVDAIADHYGVVDLESRFGADWQRELSKGSKLHQAKSALKSFFNAGFDFNWGFSYYEKSAIEIRYLNFIYRIPAGIDMTGDGLEDTVQADMLNGITVGSALRFGSDEQQRGPQDPGPVYTVRFGLDGEDVFVENDDPFGNNSGNNGDIRLVSFLVSSLDQTSAVPLSTLTYEQRMARKLFYYPAYHWGNTGNSGIDGVSWGRHVRLALEGDDTWEEVADWNNIDTSNPSWRRIVHDYVIEDITRKGDPWGSPLGTLPESNNIGGLKLWIKEEFQVYDDTTGDEWVPADSISCPTCPASQVTEVHFQEQFVLYDTDPAAGVPGPPNTLTAVDYAGTADCAGYLDLGQGEPIVPIATPDASTGATPDQRWMIEPYLGPQTQPVFYFPKQSPSFYPTVRDDYIPLTESITAIGRRPIKDAINEAKQYFDGAVDDWDDPLKNCRMNFVIIITDGVETCSNLTAPCSAASNIAPVPVYVIYFGTEDNALNPDLSTVTCVADNSGGLAFAAADEQGLINALTKIAFDIEERTRGFASPIVPSVETTSNQTAYISTFTPKQSRTIWRGHLRAYPIDPLTGLIANLRIDFTPNPLEANWDAGDTLAVRAENTRKLYYGIPAYGTDMPGERAPFLFTDGDSFEEQWNRWYLGSEIFSPEPWLDDGPWPSFRWEFRDTDVVNDLSRDEDLNLEPDLGQTWSRPVVAFLKVDDDNDSGTPAVDKMVAFFGGGYSPDGITAWLPSGNFIYGIDVETGQILFKEQVAGMVPSDLGAVDIDIDGFLESMYFGDTEGYVYKIDFTVEGRYENVTVPLLDYDPYDGIGPITVTEKRVTNWVPKVIFEASIGQPFFMRPVLAPVTFLADGSPVFAVAIGSGNRDDIMDANPLPHTFYMFLDKATSDGLPVTEADLAGFTLETFATATDNYLDGAADYGWYLRLEGNGSFTPPTDDWEKVNTSALILQGQVIFSTFNPSSDVREVPILDEDGTVIGYACRRGGNARTYVLNLTNGNAPDNGDRFIQHDSGTAMATEPVVYLGADGRIHVIQALDNLKLEEPVESFNVRVRSVNWKQQ